MDLSSFHIGADALIQASYLLTAFLFIMGLKRMSSPVTARSGILWAGAGMVVATAATFFFPGMGNFALIGIAILIGGIIAWVSGRRVAMTNMPQMIALYNGMGGGGAAAIAAVELYRGGQASPSEATLAVVGGIIGAVSFSVSIHHFPAANASARSPAGSATSRRSQFQGRSQLAARSPFTW